MKRQHSFGFLLLGIFSVLIFIKLMTGSLFFIAHRIQFVVYDRIRGFTHLALAEILIIT